MGRRRPVDGGTDRMVVMVSRWLSVLVIVALGLVAGCAPWAPAPVEDRSRVPERERTPSPPERVVATVPGFYEVQRGDTLYSIAFRYGMDWRDVADWNDIGAPYTIRPGQELRMTEPPRRPRPSARRPDRPAETASTPAVQPESAPDTDSAPVSPAEEASTPDPDPVAETRAPAPSASGSSRSVAGVDWQWPTAGDILHPFDASATRRGLGIAGSAGQPVQAAAAGEVVYSGTALIGYGELIIIKHSNTLLSAYGHNRARLVQEGDRVGRGEQIAEMGMNERDEELLHFEIRRDGQPVDPLSYLPRR